jgi:hypothetical protein
MLTICLSAVVAVIGLLIGVGAVTAEPRSVPAPEAAPEPEVDRLRVGEIARLRTQVRILEGSLAHLRQCPGCAGRCLGEALSWRGPSQPARKELLQ